MSETMENQLTATRFFENYEYYEAVGKKLELRIDGKSDKLFIPAYNVSPEDITPEDIKTADLGMRVELSEGTGVGIEWDREDGERVKEIVSWVEGGWSPKERFENNGIMQRVDEVEIKDD